MEIKKTAFSDDGYIIRQYQMDNIPWGKTTVSEMGCGFIAAYNAIKASGGEPDADALYGYFTRTLLAGGKWGTNIFQLVACLMKYGLFNGFKLTKQGYADVNVGIVLYDTGSSYHWATYYREKEEPDKFRFLNVGGLPHCKYTMDEFMSRHVKGWLRYVIKVA